MKSILLSFLGFLTLGQSAVAQEGKFATSTTVLTSGSTNGVGGGLQEQFSAFDVCHAEKVTPDLVEIATAKALGSLGLTLDPPSTDILGALKLGNEWKTGPSDVHPDLVTDYNSMARVKLDPGNNYFVTYYGRVTLRGSALILQTMTKLAIGRSSQETWPYNGDFDPKYFHIRLQSEILKDLNHVACKS